MQIIFLTEYTGWLQNGCDDDADCTIIWLKLLEIHDI